MKKRQLLLMIIVPTMLLISSTIGWGQVTIAGWTFPTSSGDAEKVHPAECGVHFENSTIYADGTNFSDNWENIVYYGGNSPSFELCDVTTATGALSLVHQTNNEKSIVFKISTLGFDDLVLNYDTRGTATGFNTHEWSYSVNGESFTIVKTIPGRTETVFSTQNVDFSNYTDINDKPIVYIKVTVSGATSDNGNNRFDNINFTAVDNSSSEPLLLVTPTSINYGNVMVTQTSSPETITVTGRNLIGNILYDIEGDISAFNISETDWDPASGGDLSITFEPTESKDYNATIIFSSSDAENKTVTLSGTGFEVEEVTYTLVTSINEIVFGGQYLFVGFYGDIYYALGWQKSSNRHAVPVEVIGNSITTTPATIVTPSQDEIYPYEITIENEDGDWLLYDALNGRYLRPQTGNSNGLVLHNLKAYWELSIYSDMTASLVCIGSEDNVTFDRNTLRFNPNVSNNSPLFACYATGQEDFYIYKSPESSIKKLPFGNNIELYPNPFVDAIYFSNIENIERVTVTNLVGQIVIDFKPTDNKIDTQNLNKGVYLVTFTCKDGKPVVKKVVRY